MTLPSKDVTHPLGTNTCIEVELPRTYPLGETLSHMNSGGYIAIEPYDNCDWLGEYQISGFGKEGKNFFDPYYLKEYKTSFNEGGENFRL